MLNDRIETIQSIIEQTGNLPAERKAELLQMMAGLQNEIGALSQTHRDEASSITRFADASAHEAVRTEKNPNWPKRRCRDYAPRCKASRIRTLNWSES